MERCSVNGYILNMKVIWLRFLGMEWEGDNLSVALEGIHDIALIHILTLLLLDLSNTYLQTNIPFYQAVNQYPKHFLYFEFYVLLLLRQLYNSFYWFFGSITFKEFQ